MLLILNNWDLRAWLGEVRELRGSFPGDQNRGVAIDDEDDDDDYTDITARKGRRSAETNRRIREISADITTMLKGASKELGIPFTSLFNIIRAECVPNQSRKDNYFNKYRAIVSRVDGKTDLDVIREQYNEIKETEGWKELIDAQYNVALKLDGHTTLTERKHIFERTAGQMTQKVCYFS